MMMTESELAAMTPRTFDNKYRGYLRKREYESRQDWEIARALGVTLLGPHLKKGAKTDNIWPLPWDHETDEKHPEKNPESEEKKYKDFQKLLERVDQKQEE